MSSSPAASEATPRLAGDSAQELSPQKLGRRKLHGTAAATLSQTRLKRVSGRPG